MRGRTWAETEAGDPGSAHVPRPTSPLPRRHLGVDYGTRRLGLALSDEGGTFVSPLEVAEITTPQQAADRVVAVVRAEGVAVLVVGLPLNMDDTEGPSARAVREWAAGVRERSGLPLIFVDERLSSFEAEQSLITRKRGGEKMTRRGKKKRLDAVAAGVILRGYLDGSLGPLPGSDLGNNSV